MRLWCHLLYIFWSTNHSHWHNDIFKGFVGQCWFFMYGSQASLERRTLELSSRYVPSSRYVRWLRSSLTCWTEVHRKNLQFVTSRNIWASFSGDPHGIWHSGGHFRRPNCGYLWWGAWLNNWGMSHLVRISIIIVVYFEKGNVKG